MEDPTHKTMKTWSQQNPRPLTYLLVSGHCLLLISSQHPSLVCPFTVSPAGRRAAKDAVRGTDAGRRGGCSWSLLLLPVSPLLTLLAAPVMAHRLLRTSVCNLLLAAGNTVVCCSLTRGPVWRCFETFLSGFIAIISFEQHTRSNQIAKVGISGLSPWKRGN